MKARRGFALIAALWLLVAISAVALELSVAAKARRLSAANVGERAAAVAAADAGIDVARARLSSLLLRPAMPRWSRLGASVLGTSQSAWAADPWSTAPQIVAGDGLEAGFRYQVTVRDPGTQLDLDRADEMQLTKLLAALRVDGGQADRVVEGILDWRDPDDLRRAHGAEREDYVRRGSALLPANGPFTSPGELRQVIGMTDAIYERLRPYVTLVGSGTVNVNAAERPVLLTLPGFTEQTVSLVLSLRAQGRRITDLMDLARLLGPGGAALIDDDGPLLLREATFETRELLLTSEASREGGARARVEVLVTRDPGVPVVWRRVR